MDLFIGISSLLVDPDESAARRRELYGRAGCHRPKPYGVEYRTVGNFWTRSPNLVRLVYRLTEIAIAASDNDIDEKYFVDMGNGDAYTGESIVRNTIDTSDIPRATELFSKYIKGHMKPETQELFNEVLGKKMDIYQEWGV
jgi:hypothetical protein